MKKWFRKPRRPRGQFTPQALTLNWKAFLAESEQRLRDLGVPPSAWANQESFERFLKTGESFGGEVWRARTGKDRGELRGLIWRYRELTKRRFGASFAEVDEASRYSAEQILRELEKSDRWGTNEQPADVRSLSEELASLPLYSVEMIGKDALRLRFLRPLVDSESKRLMSAIGEGQDDDDPFVKGDAKLDAYCWWD